MPNPNSNPLKYSTSGQSQALKTGNFWIGTGDVPKGPTIVTAYYNSITPPTGGYTVYLGGGEFPAAFCMANDSELISFTNKIAGTSYTTATECLTYYIGQSDKSCVNINYEAIVTDGLVYNVDAGFVPSYPLGATGWFNLSASSPNGTLINGTTFSSSNGGTLVFDGVDDYVFAGVTISAIQNKSYSSFIRLSDTWSLRGSIFAGARSTTNSFDVDASRRLVGGEDDVFITSPFFMSKNIWYHVSYTFEFDGNTTATQKLYVNGGLSGTLITSNYTDDYVTSTTYIGYDSRFLQYFNGDIAMLQIYNKTLTGTEVLQNYQAMFPRFLGENIVTSGMVLYLDAGYAASYPGTGTTWSDVSGYGNTFALTNGPTYSATNGGYFTFDGSNDYAQTPSTVSNTQFQYYDSFTIECFVRVQENTGSGYIVNNRASKDGNNVSYAGWGLFQNNGIIQGSIGGYPGNTFDWRFVNIAGTVFNNLVYQKWSHIVWTNDGSQGGGKIYINGTNYTNQSSDDNTPPYTINYNGTQKVTLGMSAADGSPGGNFLTGDIPIVRVYNRALSASEVLQNYNAQKSRFGL